MENLKEIEALLAERAVLKAERDGGKVTFENTKRLQEIHPQLLELLPALVSELSEAREALRWHYPGELPRERELLVIQYVGRREEIQTTLGSFEGAKWWEGYVLVARPIKRWRYAVPPQQQQETL